MSANPQDTYGNGYCYGTLLYGQQFGSDSPGDRLEFSRRTNEYQLDGQRMTI